MKNTWIILSILLIFLLSTKCSCGKDGQVLNIKKQIERCQLACTFDDILFGVIIEMGKCKDSVWKETIVKDTCAWVRERQCPDCELELHYKCWPGLWTKIHTKSKEECEKPLKEKFDSILKEISNCRSDCIIGGLKAI